MTLVRAATDTDVAVIGAGPAGWALAAALRDQGLTTLVVAPEPHGSWPATYGMWPDELPDWLTRRSGDPSTLFSHRWPTVRVAGHRTHEVDRGYGRLDNDMVRRVLTGGEVVAQTVRGVTHTRWGSRVHTTGADVTARLVVDATGSSSHWSGVRTSGTAAQVAYGLVVPTDHLVDVGHQPGCCWLMDWRPLNRSVPPAMETAGDSTFLYVLDDGHHALVEETSLVRRPPMGVEELRGRLARRLGRDLSSVALAVERVHIPMVPGRVRHTRGERVVAFGAAAGYVHPATGYSVAASLRSAPRVAAAIADVWDGDDVDHVARQAAAAVWPTAQSRVRALHDVGLAALQRLDGDGVRTFFDEFFDLPTALWSAYLRVDAEPGEIMRAMTAVFRRLPRRLQWHLATASPRGLLTAVTGGGS